MKKSIWISIIVLISNDVSAQDSTQIRFWHGGTSFNQIVQEAKAQDRYIFIDCFTTWCAPCKRMEKEVYEKADVAGFINEHFVAVKMQLDTSTADNDEVRSWYRMAADLALKYSIHSYPTFIFLSPDGEIVHKGVGFKAVKAFLTLLQEAVDTSRQYFTNLRRFEDRLLSDKAMPSLISGLLRIGEQQAADKIGEYYLDSVLLVLPMDSLFTKRNIGIMQAISQRVNSPSFRWMFEHADKIDSVMGRNYSHVIIGRRILNDEVKPSLAHWDSLGLKVVRNREWTELQKRLTRRYNQYYAEKTILDGQLQWYEKNKDWKELIALNVKKLEKYGIDTSSIGEITNVNNMIYSIIFPHCTDKKVLSKCVGFMRLICEADPEEPDFLDTYANLFYRLGQVNKALAIEQQAYSNCSKRGSKYAKIFIETIDKMKQGLPTWNLN